MNVSEIELLAQRQAIGAMYRQSVQTVWVTLVAGLCCAAFVWSHIDPIVSISWILVIGSLVIFRKINFHQRMRGQNFLDNPDGDARHHTLVVSLTGFSFAVGILVFAINCPVHIVYGFISVSVAMAAGAAMVFAIHRPSFLGYSLPLLAAPVILLVFDGIENQSSGTFILGFMSIVYAVILIGIHTHMNRVLLENYRLQIVKDQQLEGLKKDNEELSADREAYRAASLTDKLTNAPNRRHFDIILKREWERAHREDAQIACVMLDVDHFKNINDRYGHHRGDEYLQQIALSLSETLNRSADFLARYGGEEFVVILPNTDLQGATVIAEHLREAVAALGLVNEAPGANRKVVTISAGVSALDPKHNPCKPLTLLEMADTALYRAKSGGRDQVVVSDSVN